MLKNLVDRARSKPPVPTVWHGRHADIWGDPGARGYGWYCGHCGHNRSESATDADAERAARDHARTHRDVNVTPWR